jgi:phenol hydroxylase P3 protein
VWDKHKRIEAAGGRVFFQGLPQLCQICQLPIAFTEPGDPAALSLRYSEFRGERFHTCSDGCQWIFEREPEKYVQARLSVHQIFQGNCGGPTMPDVLAWYGIQQGDNGEYKDSPDARSWAEWHEGDLV